jgi:hypothetical protein
MSFPEPQGELASVAPVAQLMITGLPLWFVLAAIKLYGCYRARGGEEKTPAKNLDYEAVEEPLEKTTLDVNK